MADSFADLWSSAAPKPKPQTLGSASGSSSSQRQAFQQPNRPYQSHQDAFSLLAASGTGGGSRYGSGSGLGTGAGSAPVSRSLTPSTTTTTTTTRTASPLGGASSISRATSSTGGSNDAFGDLFSSSSSTSGSTKMTLAARLAKERGSTQGQPHNNSLPIAQQRSTHAHDAWAGLDSLGGGLGLTPAPISSSTAPAAAIMVNDDDDWGLGDFGAAPTPALPTNAQTTISEKGRSSPPPHIVGQVVSMGFTPAEARSALAKTGNGQDVQSAIDFLIGESSRSQPSNLASADEPFDFGGREDAVDALRNGQMGKRVKGTIKRGLLDLSDDDDAIESFDSHSRHPRDESHHAEDDILGLLGAPARKFIPNVNLAASNTFKNTAPNRDPSNNGPDRRIAPSPPPHILGQIVEMGFSVSQARAALAKTTSGVDVEQALESLLGGGERSSGPSATSSRSQPTGETRRPPIGQKERERARRERQEREAAAFTDNGPAIAEIQEHADRLLAQASEIGRGVFSRATELWGKGREKVVKAYEERAGPGTADFRDNTTVKGRPRWMQDAHLSDEETVTPTRQGGFTDNFEEGKEHIRQLEEPQRPAVHEEIDLFAPGPVLPKRSQASSSTPALPRRPTPVRGASTQASSSRASPTPRTTFSAPSIPDRALPTASQTSLASALQQKTKGTAAFKLGQHADAAEAYGRALDALPAGHLLCIHLYTNRAVARMKAGDLRGAEEDCICALVGVIGDSGAEPDSSWSPARLAPNVSPAHGVRVDMDSAWTHPQGVGVDLADGYLKALRRRAECREARESWEDALRDWEVLAGYSWAPELVRREAGRGQGRCRKMVGGGVSRGDVASPNSTPAAKPKPKPKPRAAPPVATTGKALAALQATTAAAEADDAAKHALKDTVDARVLAWKGGKEANIRALIASLDAVLWPEVLENVRVRGLSDLVSAAQVKKAYVKAVARVHPDKLNERNSTVEQRMLANAVFGALNEAWIAFQAGQT